MFDEVDERFQQIVDVFLKNHTSTDEIKKAYLTAKDLHKDQKRKDGRPYISHPVEVALVLANLGFDEDVVSGALLHDVVEDCGYTLEDIEKNFNRNVRELVDCVSAIDETKFVFDQDDLYENKDFEKASIEEQSFKKLISIGKKNPQGFCIKFADRLHNLRTIDCFDYSKQLEKVRETERWIVPIAKILKTEYFYRSIKNECFKIVHKYDGKMYFEQYKTYHNANEIYVKQLLTKLNEVFANTFVKSIKIHDVREYKVFEDLEELMKTLTITKISQGQILHVTNYNIYMLYISHDENNALGEVLSILKRESRLKIKVIDAKIGRFTSKPYFQLEDAFKNKYNLYVMSGKDYVTQKIGTLDGQINELIDEDNGDNLDVELMKVLTRSGEVAYVPKDSTVLDFAFKLHKDLGMGFKYAIINKSNTKSPPYTKLNEGDQIEIIVDRNANGDIVDNSQIKWFAYVNTYLAKKMLIKNFEKMLNSNNFVQVVDEQEINGKMGK